MPDLLNIAIIAGQLVVGGAEQQLYLWLSHLDRDKFNPVVLTLHPHHDDYWEKPIEELGIPIFRIPRKSLRWMRLIDIIKIVKPLKPDLIQGWHLFPSPYAGIAAKALNCFSLGGFRDSYNIFTKSGRIGKSAIRLTDGLLVNSRTTAEKIQSVYPHRSDRIFSVQNAVIDEFFERSKAREKLVKEFKLDQQKTWVGSMGRLDPKKHFNLLLQVISKINDDSFQCILIGDGSEMQKLVDLSSALGIEHKIVFTGEIPNAASYLKALDIFAFTSVDEGMPNVIMEAAAAGLPIVTWQLPFYEELLENHKTALLVKAGDMQAFEDALLSLINSPEQRQNLGQAARQQMLSNFSLATFVDNMTAVYETILSGMPQPRDTR